MHILHRCQSSEDLPLPGNYLNPVKNRIIVLPGISANRETVWEFGQPFSKASFKQREVIHRVDVAWKGVPQSHRPASKGFVELCSDGFLCAGWASGDFCSFPKTTVCVELYSDVIGSFVVGHFPYHNDGVSFPTATWPLGASFDLMAFLDFP